MGARGGEGAAQAGAEPEFAGLRVELARVIFEPFDCSVEADRFAEAGFVAEMVEHDDRSQGVFGHPAEGDVGPDAFFFLEVGEVDKSVIDGFAGATAAQESAEAQRSQDGIAPATVGFLCGKEGNENFVVDRGTGLPELIKADHGHGGGGDGQGTGLEQGEELGVGAAGDELGEQGVVPAGGPETLDVFHGLHRQLPFFLERSLLGSNYANRFIGRQGKCTV